MVFEGSEKKVEVVIDDGGPSLRHHDKKLWKQLVKACGAQVLSVLSNDHCDAYLLSESSLFVWDNQFTMITCGQTDLAQSVLEFFKHVPKESVRSLIFERKNEYFPDMQPTDFNLDMQRIQLELPGQVFHFGQQESHHLHLFHYHKDFMAPKDDNTLEILMYDLQGVAKETFMQKSQDKSVIHQNTGVNRVLPGFLVDDYVFDPYGYSLNAIEGPNYYTIHVTPQDVSSYVSFETNITMEQNYLPVIGEVLGVFKPRSFDIVTFNADRKVQLTIPGFEARSDSHQELGSGYQVSFTHFYQEK